MARCPSGHSVHALTPQGGCTLCMLRKRGRDASVDNIDSLVTAAAGYVADTDSMEGEHFESLRTAVEEAEEAVESDEDGQFDEDIGGQPDTGSEAAEAVGLTDTAVDENARDLFAQYCSAENMSAMVASRQTIIARRLFVVFRKEPRCRGGFAAWLARHEGTSVKRNGRIEEMVTLGGKRVTMIESDYEQVLAEALADKKNNGGSLDDISAENAAIDDLGDGHYDRDMAVNRMFLYFERKGWTKLKDLHEWAKHTYVECALPPPRPCTPSRTGCRARTRRLYHRRPIFAPPTHFR